MRPYAFPEEDALTVITPRHTNEDESTDDEDEPVDVRKEGTRHARTWQWIEDWMLAFLARYQGKTYEELIVAADKDEFRYLGRTCRCDLVDALRKLKTKKNPQPRMVNLDAPDEDRVAPLEGIGTERQDAPSSLARHNSFEEFLECAEETRHAIQANKDEPDRLDLIDSLPGAAPAFPRA